MQRGGTKDRYDLDPMPTSTILHVDDDAVFLDLTRGLLEQEGVEVASESDPQAVLGRLVTTRVDAVVSDYEMPGMDGGALFERVHAEHPALPFVLFTGKDRSEVSMELGSADGAWYVQKRSADGFERLVSVLRAVFDGSGATPREDR